MMKLLLTSLLWMGALAIAVLTSGFLQNLFVIVSFLSYLGFCAQVDPTMNRGGQFLALLGSLAVMMYLFMRATSLA